MLQAYSTNIEVTANSAIPFNNLKIKKGCTAELVSPTTIALNKCGAYMVSVDVSAPATEEIQLYKNGVAQPEAQSTGLTPSFVTLVQVTENNSCCPCSSPTNIQVIGSAAQTLTNANIVVTKVI